MFLNDHLTSVAAAGLLRCGIAISIIVSRLRSSQWDPFLALRSPLHPEGVSSSTLAPCPPHPSLILQPRNSRGTRSAVVREQTGYRAAVSLGREHLIIAKMHARGLHNVFTEHKRHLGATASSLRFRPLWSCVTALDDRREKQR